MRAIFVRCLTLAGCLWAATIVSPASPQNQLLANAEQLFGNPLNVDHRVYPLGDNYALWLIVDGRGELVEVDVGPKSSYPTEFPNTPRSSGADRLSPAEYEGVLRKISQLKGIGTLLKSHESVLSSAFGLINTDEFDNAFVDRVVAEGQREEVKTFDLYYLHEESGSPEQVQTVQGHSMVCLVGVWYYLKPAAQSKLSLGKWQTLLVAGPNLLGTEGCHPTTVLHDADGFIIEYPQSILIVVHDPYRVRELAGRVTVAYQPVADANVEVLAVGGGPILRTKTDAEGKFRITHASKGEYRFKVTKNGFRALAGKVIVDRNAPPGPLSFFLEVGI